MTAFVNHFVFELNTGIRNKNLLLLTYLFPLGFYLMLGFIFPELNPAFLDNMIPAMVGFAVLAATFLGIPDPLVNAREAGIYRSYKINGVPPSSIITIPALTTIVHMAVVSAIITISAPLLFDAPLPVNWPAYILVFAVAALACAGLSVLIGVISSSTRVTVLWSQLLFIPSMLLGGMMLPSSMLPDSVASISRILPSTHFMNAFNVLAMGSVSDFSPWGSVIVLSLSGVLAFGLAIYLFNWDRHNATRRGHPVMAVLALLPYVASMFLL